jgi:membrane-associated phospholipid phosphatase
VAYVVGTFVYLRSTGRIPVDREIITGWVVGMAVVACVGRPWRDVGRVLLSWAPFLLALFFYDFARSVGYRIYSHHGGIPFVVTPQITVDRWLGGGHTWTERLQGWLVPANAGLGHLPMAEVERRLKYDDSTIRWYDVMVAIVYTSHFIVPYLTAGYLWRKGQRIWRWYAGTFVAVSFACCAIFALVATAPPWYAAAKGLIDPFPRVLATRAWKKVGLAFAARVIDKGKGTVNPFAAIPSLHSADALLIALFVWPHLGKWTKWIVRPVLVAFPLLMAFTLVYSGEHYLIDVLTGWAMVGVALAGGWWLRRRYGWGDPWRDGPDLGQSRMERPAVGEPAVPDGAESRVGVDGSLGTRDEIAQVTS